MPLGSRSSAYVQTTYGSLNRVASSPETVWFTNAFALGTAIDPNARVALAFAHPLSPALTCALVGSASQAKSLWLATTRKRTVPGSLSATATSNPSPKKLVACGASSYHAGAAASAVRSDATEALDGKNGVDTFVAALCRLRASVNAADGDACAPSSSATMNTSYSTAASQTGHVAHGGTFVASAPAASAVSRDATSSL